MIARDVSAYLKPGMLAEFNRIFTNDVLPILRRQPGFKDELLLAVRGNHAVISVTLWDNKEHAEAYQAGAFSQVVKLLDKVLDGEPRVRTTEVLQSTAHGFPQSAMAAAAPVPAMPPATAA